jgi:2-polyprenyl-6-hydroxyphenyl methylase/3-demethylubiquinone-9 3-methyltransferase
VSFDFDAESVACTKELRESYDPDGPWRVEQGSALDRTFLASLGQYDVVYSWGVLHHTGALWDALDAVTALVAPAGLFWVALYNDQGRKSQAWAKLKKWYVSTGPIGKKVIHGTVGNALYARSAIGDKVRKRTRRRGMDRRRDIVDWIGGWPFEVSSREDVIAFYEERGLQLEKVNSVGRLGGNNEFLFRRS